MYVGGIYYNIIICHYTNRLPLYFIILYYYNIFLSAEIHFLTIVNEWIFFTTPPRPQSPSLVSYAGAHCTHYNTQHTATKKNENRDELKGISQ